jgi:hypothetical protein
MNKKQRGKDNQAFRRAQQIFAEKAQHRREAIVKSKAGKAGAK